MAGDVERTPAPEAEEPEAPADAVEQASGTASPAVDEAVRAAFEAELAEARRQVDENWDRYLRAEADLENLRRRSARLRNDAITHQRRDLLGRFLDVADNLERALAHADSDPGALASGVDGTYRELLRQLQLAGVEPFASMDVPFDPALHEAVGVVPVPDLAEERVISVDRTGYTLDGDLLRPARVIVGQPVTEPVVEPGTVDELEGRDADGDVGDHDG